MISALGEKLNRWSERYVPDPFVLVLVLTMVTAAMVFVFGANVQGEAPAARALLVGEYWFGEFYDVGLMRFALQMVIVLVTGHALAMAPPVRRGIRKMALWAGSPSAAVVLVALVACLASLLQWGLGAIAGAFMAREVGRVFADRGIAVHYPLLGAAGYAGFLVWHGGLAGTAPLAVAQSEHDLIEVLGQIPVSETLFGTMNLVVIGSLLVIIPLLFWLLMPRDPEKMVPIPESQRVPDEVDMPSGQRQAHGLIQWLEESRGLNLIVGGAMACVLAVYFWREGAAGWHLDSLNLSFLTLGLLAHGSPRSYGDAIVDGVKGAGPIVLQFPFYFGILGLLRESGMIEQISAVFMAISTETTYPIFTFLSAGLVNFFVPSGGGQWAVQGPIMAEAIDDLGVSAEKVIMALSYGDAWTNMLQPFWALPLLGIMGLRAKDIIGYTGFVFLVTGPWIIFLLWLL